MIHNQIYRFKSISSYCGCLINLYIGLLEQVNSSDALGKSCKLSDLKCSESPNDLRRKPKKMRSICIASKNNERHLLRFQNLLKSLVNIALSSAGQYYKNVYPQEWQKKKKSGKHWLGLYLCIHLFDIFTCNNLYLFNLYLFLTNICFN